MLKTGGKHHSHQGGFSLVELAISTVVVGVVLGLVVAGLGVLESSRVTATVTQVTSLERALEDFKSAYHALPGDFDRAQAFIENCTTALNCENGDGNGAIGTGNDLNPAWNAVLSDDSETVQAWRHLALSGIMPSASTNQDGLAWGNSHPQSSLGGGFEIFYDSDHSVNGSSLGSGHFLRFSSELADEALGDGDGVYGVSAKNIDAKLDDGNPFAGKVTASAGADGQCVDETTMEASSSYDDAATDLAAAQAAYDEAYAESEAADADLAAATEEWSAAETQLLAAESQRNQQAIEDKEQAQQDLEQAEDDYAAAQQNVDEKEAAYDKEAGEASEAEADMAAAAAERDQAAEEYEQAQADADAVDQYYDDKESYPDRLDAYYARQAMICADYRQEHGPTASCPPGGAPPEPPEEPDCCAITGSRTDDKEAAIGNSQDNYYEAQDNYEAAEDNWQQEEAEAYAAQEEYEEALDERDQAAADLEEAEDNYAQASAEAEEAEEAEADYQAAQNDYDEAAANAGAAQARASDASADEENAENDLADAQAAYDAAGTAYSAAPREYNGSVLGGSDCILFVKIGS